MHNHNQPTNISAVVCYSSPREYVISFLHAHRCQTLSEHLQINRSTQEISIIKSVDKIGFDQRQYSSFLGIVQIQGQKFLLMCDQCKKASSLEKMQSYEISSLDFLSYRGQKKMKEHPRCKQIYQKIRDYYLIMKDGFYFSHNYNLTQSFPDQSLSTIALNFAWNRHLLGELDKYQISCHWKIPVIQGFVSSFDIFYKGVKIRYMLVTRRSNQKGGTRYFDRGVNDEGFVANYCESQQIVKIDQYCFSDLQIRGSLPIFFQQVGLYTKTKVNRGFELTHEAYLKHIHRIIRQYKRVFMVNLLTMGKRGQKLLTEQIESHIKAEPNPDLKYLYYDFHHQVKGNKFEMVDEIIQKIKQMKINLGYYVYNSQTDQVLRRPEGIFRTNCLDCLDRTNFFQAKLAIITLQHIFRKLNVADLDLLSEMRNNRDNFFIKKFRNIWADNGDAVSWHYTGTGSTHTDITRDGKRGFLGNIKHKYKSITRFYNQNFWDFYKMKAVNLLLGTKKDLCELNASHRLKERQTEYVNTEQISIYIFTWKAPKIAPLNLPNFPTDVDLLVICVQDLSDSERWFQIISDSIDKTKYVKIDSQCVSDNLLIVYVKNELKGRVSAVELGNIKFSSYYNALISNKSANFIRLSVDSSKLVFVSCQLQKGREFVENRIKNLKEIHEYAFQYQEVGIQKSETILFDEAIFLIGNMNTRVSSSFRNDFSKLAPQQLEVPTPLIKKMMATDEFEHIRMSLLEYRVYEEEPIRFLPTYRYAGGSFDPDHSGWTDRIWFSSQGTVKCQLYDVIKELRQQHVPVVGKYVVEIKKINQDEQQRIGEQIMKEEQAKQDLEVLSEEQDSGEIAL